MLVPKGRVWLMCKSLTLVLQYLALNDSLQGDAGCAKESRWYLLGIGGCPIQWEFLESDFHRFVLTKSVNFPAQYFPPFFLYYSLKSAWAKGIVFLHHFFYLQFWLHIEICIEWFALYEICYQFCVDKSQLTLTLKIKLLSKSFGSFFDTNWNSHDQIIHTFWIFSFQIRNHQIIFFIQMNMRWLLFLVM